jgi:hypothetical protein
MNAELITLIVLLPYAVLVAYALGGLIIEREAP